MPVTWLSSALLSQPARQCLVKCPLQSFHSTQTLSHTSVYVSSKDRPEVRSRVLPFCSGLFLYSTWFSKGSMVDPIGILLLLLCLGSFSAGQYSSSASLCPNVQEAEGTSPPTPPFCSLDQELMTAATVATTTSHSLGE